MQTSYLITLSSEELDQRIKSAVVSALNDYYTNGKGRDVKNPASIKEACEFLGISHPTLNVLIKTGQLKSFNIGRHVRINWHELERFVNEK